MGAVCVMCIMLGKSACDMKQIREVDADKKKDERAMRVLRCYGTHECKRLERSDG